MVKLILSFKIYQAFKKTYDVIVQGTWYKSLFLLLQAKIEYNESPL